jgi:hypothetical protein
VPFRARLTTRRRARQRAGQGGGRAPSADGRRRALPGAGRHATCASSSTSTPDRRRPAAQASFTPRSPRCPTRRRRRRPARARGRPRAIRAGRTCPRRSAAGAPASAARWGVFEAEIHGPAHGNPLRRRRAVGGVPPRRRAVRVPGFYDGDGVYRSASCPDTEGGGSSAREQRPLARRARGQFTCTAGAPADHGPVRVHNRFHFRHADGTRCIPLGTTAYAWTHQGASSRSRRCARWPVGLHEAAHCACSRSPTCTTQRAGALSVRGVAEAGWDFTRPNPRSSATSSAGSRSWARSGSRRT